MFDLHRKTEREVWIINFCCVLSYRSISTSLMAAILCLCFCINWRSVGANANGFEIAPRNPAPVSAWNGYRSILFIFIVASTPFWIRTMCVYAPVVNSREINVASKADENKMTAEKPGGSIGLSRKVNPIYKFKLSSNQKTAKIKTYNIKKYPQKKYFHNLFGQTTHLSPL